MDVGARFALETGSLHGSWLDPVMESMDFLNEIVARYPEAISFAPGRPSESAFALGDIERYLQRYLRYLREDAGLDESTVSRTIFQYGRTNGIIHELIARNLQVDEDITVAPGDLVVTVGAQEAMFVTLRALCAPPRDVLLVAEPCYVGILGAARLLDVPVVAVPEDAGGLDPARLARTVARVRAEGLEPKAFYLVPNFANPSGTSLSLARRHELLALARSAGVLLIEDNPYGTFSRTDERRPTLKALDRHAGVIYIGSFAKTCFPGARVGYVIADQEVERRDGRPARLADVLGLIKSMLTVNTSALAQAVVGGMLLCNDFSLRQANRAVLQVYRDNLDVLLAELEAHFPPAERARLGVRWDVPEGGFFLVVHLPFEADLRLLEISAQDYGVSWTPMRFFYLDGGGERALRLSYSMLRADTVRAGVQRLAALIRDHAAAP